MTAKEFIDNWQKVLAIYKETAITNSPKITAEKIIEEIGKENALTVFSTIAKIKRYDGRIYGKVREAMNKTPFVQEVVDRGDGYHMPFKGLDDIHTTHISQIIEYLIKE